jgi:hypothetical protein
MLCEKQQNMLSNYSPVPAVATANLFKGQGLGRKRNNNHFKLINIMAGHTELNEEEREALKGLSHLQRCAYVFGIRWFMDSKTKIAGIKRGISYQSIAEELYVEPVPGIQDTGTPSRMQMRRSVAALEKAGLIKNKSVGKKLILECVLARQSNYVQNKADTRPTQQADTQADTEEKQENDFKNNNLKHGPMMKADPQADTAKTPQADTPPLSNRLHNITLPSASDFFQLLAQSGFPLHQIQGNKSTLAMVNEWIKAKVTLNEAQIGINHVNSGKGIPNSPTYYLKPVLQVRRDFEKAHQQANEVNHAKPKSTNIIRTNSPERITKTQGFFESCLPAVTRNRRRGD